MSQLQDVTRACRGFPAQRHPRDAACGQGRGFCHPETTARNRAPLVAKQPVPPETLVASNKSESCIYCQGTLLHTDPPTQFSLKPSLHSFKASFQRIFFNSLAAAVSLPGSGGGFFQLRVQRSEAQELVHGGKRKSIEISLCRAACHNTELKLSNTIGYFAGCCQHKGGNRLYLLAYPSPNMLNCRLLIGCQPCFVFSN